MKAVCKCVSIVLTVEMYNELVTFNNSMSHVNVVSALKAITSSSNSPDPSPEPSPDPEKG